MCVFFFLTVAILTQNKVPGMWIDCSMLISIFFSIITQISGMIKHCWTVLKIWGFPNHQVALCCPGIEVQPTGWCGKPGDGDMMGRAVQSLGLGEGDYMTGFFI